MVNKVLFHKWHSWCCWCQQPVICHTWWQVMSENKRHDLQSVQTKHISVPLWHRKNSWRRSHGLCHKWTDRFSLYWLQVMSFVFAHDLSPWDRLHEFCLCHKWTLICLVCTKFMKTILVKPNFASTERRILHLELFNEKIPSIPRNKWFVLATFYVNILNLLTTCV
jgi:hypothetical protein